MQEGMMVVEMAEAFIDLIFYFLFIVLILAVISQ